MVILGYSLALLMGGTLGLTGSGGAILTVPILVYFLGVKPTIATGYSLLLVGCTATVGAARYWQQGHFYHQAILLFGIPAMIMMWVTRTLIFPLIPESPLSIGNTPISKDTLIMLLFGTLMLCSASFMLFSKTATYSQSKPKLHILRAAFCIVVSIGVGLLGGMLGMGGSFLILPPMIGLLGLEMKEAIGSSLTVIAINSLIGFTSDVATGIPLDLPLLGTFLALALLGILGGTALSRSLSSATLKRGFGCVVLCVGLFVLTRECLCLIST